MSSFADTLKQLGPSRLGIMAAILVGLVLFFIFVSFRVSAPEMNLLYSNLSSVDSGAIAAKLEENEVRYEVSADGSRIVVPSDQVGRARLLLAEAGLPNGGSLGYEIFDEESGFGTTNFVQNVNQVRALQGELARTISSLDAVRSAKVLLVLPQRELFSRDSRPPKASVNLGLRPGANLEREQVLAVQSLVASAVPELKASNVTIVDGKGNLLAQGGEEGENAQAGQAEEFRLNYEARLTEKIEDQVSRIVGHGNVRASVTAEINFDRVSTNEELYDPETVVRSSQVTEENETEREPIASDVTVANNLPGVGGDLLADNQPSLQNNRLEEITNYEISRTTRSIVREGGDIQRLSVAVLVDGRYVTNAEGVKEYQPRAQAELDQIAALVRSAVGVSDDRGDLLEVVNLQFAVVDTDEAVADDRLLLGFEKSDLLDVAEIFTVAIMIILVVMLVLQPMVGKLLASEGGTNVDDELEADLLAMRPANPALAGPMGATGADGEFMPSEGGDEDESLIDIQGVEGKVKASSIRKVEEIIENYPDEAVSVIRSWMTQETQ